MGGIQTWLAYCLLERAVKSSDHYEGQAKDRKQFSSLENLSIDKRRELALEVSSKVTSEKNEKFRKIETSLRSISGEEPEASAEIGQLDSTQVPRPSYNQLGTPNEKSFTATDGHFDVSHPAVYSVQSTFPGRFFETFRRDEKSNTVGITMSFLKSAAFGSELGCMMSIEIMAKEVEGLAKVLFGADIVTKGNHRYFIRGDGLEISPSPDIVLRGCLRNVQREWFGFDTAKAIQGIASHKAERQDNHRTQCVSMTISHDATSTAFLNFVLAEKEGFRLRGRLYGF